MNSKTILIVLGVYLVIFVIYASMTPDETDWTATYRSNGTSPFDKRVLFEQFPEVLAPARITKASLPIYNSLGDTTLTDGLFFDVQHGFFPTALDLDQLMRFVRRGNTAFISATAMSEEFLDSLGTSMNYQIKPKPTWTDQGPVANTRVTISSLPDTSWMALSEWSYQYFPDTSLTSLDCKVLGGTKEGKAVFVRFSVGKGEVYLHTIPTVFTNYYMLYTSLPDYVSGVLHYLPMRANVVWNDYSSGTKFGASVLGVMSRFLGFRIAFWLMLVGVTIFIFFTVKRRQRMVPVLVPPRNTGLDFVTTMGNLYFNRGTHKDLVAKKLMYFKDHIRDKYRVTIEDLDADTAVALAERSELDHGLVQDAFNYITECLEARRVSTSQLKSLQQKLDIFYERF